MRTVPSWRAVLRRGQIERPNPVVGPRGGGDESIVERHSLVQEALRNVREGFGAVAVRQRKDSGRPIGRDLRQGEVPRLSIHYRA